MGKIKRDSFLELVRSSSGLEESDQFREQIKTGKLNVTELYRNNQKPEAEAEMIRVGKLNTKVSLLSRDSDPGSRNYPKYS